MAVNCQTGEGYVGLVNAMCPKCQARYFEEGGLLNGYMEIAPCPTCRELVRKNPHDEREAYKRRYPKIPPSRQPKTNRC